jgi:hypothetical protein
MKNNILVIAAVIIGIFFRSYTSDSGSSSAAAAVNKVLLTMDGKAKTLEATAIKTNSEIKVTASIATSRSSALETIRFVAYENEFATKIYDFVYTKDGEAYSPALEADLVNTLTKHSGGKSAGTFSGTVKNIYGESITLNYGRLNVNH